MLYRKLSLKLFIFYYSFITNINVFVNLLFFCNTLKNISKIKKLREANCMFLFRYCNYFS